MRNQSLHEIKTNSVSLSLDFVNDDDRGSALFCRLDHGQNRNGALASNLDVSGSSGCGRLGVDDCTLIIYLFIYFLG